MKLKLTLAAALLMSGAAFAAQPGGNPGNQCQGNSCQPLPPQSPACDTPAGAHNPHCKPGGGPGDDGPGNGPGDDGPGVGPVDPVTPGRTGARRSNWGQGEIMHECPVEWPTAVLRPTWDRSIWEVIASALAQHGAGFGVPVQVNPDNGWVINILPKGASEHYAVAALPGQMLCVVHLPR
jgi:hypothetical protein